MKLQDHPDDMKHAKWLVDRAVEIMDAAGAQQIVPGEVGEASGGVHLLGTAHDGESAVRMAEALEPNLVLLDIAMPGLDGIEVARALSRNGESPAVVFITAFDQFAVAAFDVAAIDYLMKPFKN